MALVQLIQQQQWAAAVMLAGGELALLDTPVVDGAASRASEFSVDA